MPNIPQINLNKVKAIRIEHGKSQDDIASVIDKTKPTYSKKENGISNFTLEEAKILADYYNRSIEEIFFAPPVT